MNGLILCLFAIATVIYSALGHAAGTKIWTVNSLENTAITNGLCEFTEAIEAVQKDLDIDGCRAKEEGVDFQRSKVRFLPQLFAEGPLPKVLVLEQSLRIKFGKGFRSFLDIEGPGIDQLTIQGKSDVDVLFDVYAENSIYCTDDLCRTIISDMTLEGTGTKQTAVYGTPTANLSLNNLISAFPQTSV